MANDLNKQLALEQLISGFHDVRDQIKRLMVTEQQLAHCIAEQRCPFTYGQIVRRGRYSYKILDIHPTGHGRTGKVGRKIGWCLDVVQVRQDGKVVGRRLGHYLYHTDDIQAVT